MSKPIKSLPRSKLCEPKPFQNMLFRNFTYSHMYLERNWLKQKNLFTQNVLLLCYTKAICMSFNTHTQIYTSNSICNTFSETRKLNSINGFWEIDIQARAHAVCVRVCYWYTTKSDKICHAKVPLNKS